MRRVGPNRPTGISRTPPRQLTVRLGQSGLEFANAPLATRRVTAVLGSFRQHGQGEADIANDIKRTRHNGQYLVDDGDGTATQLMIKAH